MKLRVLNTGSSGNGYVLQSKTGSLVIDAGVHQSKLKEALEFNICQILGVICTHAHQDHSKYIEQYRNNGIVVYDKWESKEYNIGAFKIRPFSLIHDVVNWGFLIHHEEMGNCLFATDTHYLPYKFPNLNQVILEVNYQKELLDENVRSGSLLPFVIKRIMYSHMSLDTAKGVLEANDLTNVNNIVLIHLSKGNANASQIKSEITDLTGKMVHIAKEGMSIEFNKTI